MDCSILRKKFNESLFDIYNSEELNIIFYIVMQNLTNKSKLELMTSNYKLGNVKEKIFYEYVNRLSNYEPIQYILGNTIFNNLEFDLDNSVLIPRPETEELVDLIIKHECKKEKILDIGSGSGCIAIALAKYILRSNVTALEICPNAVKIINKNASKNNVEIDIICEDLFTFQSKSTFDLIVSNPPYIVYSQKYKISKNVLNFEPHHALFVNDNDPLIFYKVILNFSKNNLNVDGNIFFEINDIFHHEMIQLVSKYQNFSYKLIKDFHGKKRFMILKKNT
ncbi:MAG: protein-(glutamine-N5) methyltransferase, release factor-specific [Bacteroidetes bacterium MED-G13]|nr:MAG: protein-(glutamine-N5) methyltransferase, release factor-specific [Bacteroidetes bacterium MED-G13]